MTTRSYDAPRLDRLVTHTYAGPSPGRGPYGGVIPGSSATRRVWVAYRPFRAAQLVDGESGLITVLDARFIARFDAVWATGQRFTFGGSTWEVRAVNEAIERERYVKIIGRRLT